MAGDEKYVQIGAWIGDSASPKAADNAEVLGDVLFRLHDLANRSSHHVS